MNGDEVVSVAEALARLKRDAHPQIYGHIIALERAISLEELASSGRRRPIAWRWPGGYWQDCEPSIQDAKKLEAAQVKPEFMHSENKTRDAMRRAIDKLAKGG